LEIEGRIAQANGRLKAAKVGVQIQQKGDRLYLRATLPPKPGSSKTVPHQQRLATGQPANPRGVSEAEKEARKVGALLQCREFDWDPYLKSPDSKQTIAHWIERYERNYFARRKRSPKSETTWRGDYLKVFGELPADKPLTADLLIKAVEAKKPDTRTRKRFVDVLSRLAKFAGVDCDLLPYKGNYSPSRPNPRTLPDDQTIALWRDKIPNPEWKRAYGLLAVYGLRPHELFSLRLDNYPEIEVGDETKTDSRLIYPLYPEWASAWDLQGNLPSVTGADSSALGNRVTHAFKRYKIPFKPYDLRHAWAVRAIHCGLPDSLAADFMGHSLQVHNIIYQAWISKDFKRTTYQRIMSHPDRPQPPVTATPASMVSADSDRSTAPH
jgi:integrase